ncbi:hypothetical protein ACIQH6_29245, partial [Micromonospora orduensis]
MPGHRLGYRLVQRQQLGADVLVEVGRDDVVRQGRGGRAPTLVRLGARTTVLAAGLLLATRPVVGPETTLTTVPTTEATLARTAGTGTVPVAAAVAPLAVATPEATLTRGAALTTVTATEAALARRAGTATVAALVTTLTTLTATETTLATVATTEAALAVAAAETAFTRGTRARTATVATTETAVAVATAEATLTRRAGTVTIAALVTALTTVATTETAVAVATAEATLTRRAGTVTIAALVTA